MLGSRLVMHRTNLDVRLSIVLVIALTPLLVVACNGSPDLGVVSFAPPPGAPIRFAADIQPIFTTTCASTTCHGSTAQANLNLEPANAYSNLVGVDSFQQPALKLVDPVEGSDMSYIIIKLEGNQLIGERMPQGGPFLSQMEIRVIRDWIDQGALDN